MVSLRLMGVLSLALAITALAGRAVGQNNIVRKNDVPSPVLCTDLVGELLPKDGLKKLAGVWLVDDEQMIDVRVAKDGTIASASIRWDEKSQRFETDVESLFVRKIGDNLILFVKSNQNGEVGYWFFRLEESSQGFSLFLPSAERFENEASALDILKVTPKFAEKLQSKDSFSKINQINLVRILR
ncbi:MAG: hypothetical protein U0930_06785 [Pirellulales bacterium]